MPIDVKNTKQLKDALVPENEGQQIRAQAGPYYLDAPLTVPEGARLEGDGAMVLVAGLPVGFVTSTVTRIVPLPSVSGDFVTLGNGSSLHRLLIEDVPGRVGNLIAIGSRGEGSLTSAEIVDCEVVNPNGFQVGGPDGPRGGAITAPTLNPELGSPPGPHTRAKVKVEIKQSIIRAAFRALFATNFASKGDVKVELTNNLIAGTIDAIGGLSRPDAVTDAKTRIVSSHNVYRPTEPVAWIICGGSSPPFGAPAPEATSRNTIDVDSSDDRVEGFLPGIQAFAGRRLNDAAEFSSENKANLNLERLTIHTTRSPEPMDFFFIAAFSPGDRKIGDHNKLRVTMHDCIGTGVLDPSVENFYRDVVGPLLAALGAGNELKFTGNAAEFAASNEGIPTPPAHFF